MVLSAGASVLKYHSYYTIFMMFAFHFITIISLICFVYKLIFECEKVIFPCLQPFAFQIFRTLFFLALFSFTISQIFFQTSYNIIYSMRSPFALGTSSQGPRVSLFSRLNLLHPGSSSFLVHSCFLELIFENISKTEYMGIKFLSLTMSENILIDSLAGYKMLIWVSL